MDACEKKTRRSPRWRKLIVDGVLVSVYPVSLEGQKERRMAALMDVQLSSATRDERMAFLEKFKVEISVELWAWDQKKKQFRKERIKRA